MNELTLFDVNSQFNLVQFVGLAGAPTIQQLVEYLKTEWKLPTYLAPLAAVVLGMIVNVALAAYFGADLRSGILMGILTGGFASGWHEVAKK